jgi:hypothetical protein
LHQNNRSVGDKAKEIGSETSLSMSSSHLPNLDKCIEIYLDVWDEFRTDSFSISEFVVELQSQNPDTDIFADGGPQRHFDLLVAYGLFEKVSSNRYQVRCSPDETQLEWWQQLETQIETLHNAVHQTQQTTSGEDTHPLLTYRGQRYVSLYVDEQTQPTDISESLAEIEEFHDGIVLRSPAMIADDVQDIADSLSAGVLDAKQAFEKVNSEVKGADSTDLEFRLYMNPHHDS